MGLNTYGAVNYDLTDDERHTCKLRHGKLGWRRVRERSETNKGKSPPGPGQASESILGGRRDCGASGFREKQLLLYKENEIEGVYESLNQIYRGGNLALRRDCHGADEAPVSNQTRSQISSYVTVSVGHERTSRIHPVVM